MNARNKLNHLMDRLRRERNTFVTGGMTVINTPGWQAFAYDSAGSVASDPIFARTDGEGRGDCYAWVETQQNPLIPTQMIDNTAGQIGTFDDGTFAVAVDGNTNIPPNTPILILPISFNGVSINFFTLPCQEPPSLPLADDFGFGADGAVLSASLVSNPKGVALTGSPVAFDSTQTLGGVLGIPGIPCGGINVHPYRLQLSLSAINSPTWDNPSWLPSAPLTVDAWWMPNLNGHNDPFLGHGNTQTTPGVRAWNDPLILPIDRWQIANPLYVPAGAVGDGWLARIELALYGTDYGGRLFIPANVDASGHATAYLYSPWWGESGSAASQTISIWPFAASWQIPIVSSGLENAPGTRPDGTLGVLGTTIYSAVQWVINVSVLQAFYG